MPCYNSIDGEPASVSHRLLTELLRERMGFDGLCISDYGGISNAHEVQRIGETIGETGFLAMEAGMDMEMPKAIGYGEKLKEMFRSGQADTELLNRTVLRVLEAKFRMGLFEQPFAMDGESCKKIFEEKEGAELSLRSARESMVLLKNNGVLPLSGKIKKLALIGPHADCARKFFGGYTHVETVVLLSKGMVDSRKVKVDFSLENMDLSEFKGKATYEQIKAYVLEQTGLKVSSLYIAQIKKKCGLDVGENFNLPKSENARQPQCTPEKEEAIMQAFKHFGIV